MQNLPASHTSAPALLHKPSQDAQPPQMEIAQTNDQQPVDVKRPTLDFNNAINYVNKIKVMYMTNNPKLFS